MLKLKETDLNKLLDEVSEELSTVLNSEKLSKSEQPLKKDLGSDKPEESPGEDHAGSPPAPAADEASAPSAEASDSAQPSAEAPVDTAGSPDPAAESGPELSVEGLQAEYEQLPPDELQMHLQAAMAAAQKLGMAGGAPQGEGASPSPSAPPPAPPEATAAPQPPPAMKSEKAEGEKLAKAEEEITSLKEDVEILTKTVKSLIETPVRKAITSIDQLPTEEKAEASYKPLTTQDFWSKLKEVSKRSDLKKSDKQLIMDIYEKRVTPEVAAKRLVKLFADE